MLMRMSEALSANMGVFWKRFALTFAAPSSTLKLGGAGGIILTCQRMGVFFENHGALYYVSAWMVPKKGRSEQKCAPRLGSSAVDSEGMASAVAGAPILTEMRPAFGRQPNFESKSGRRLSESQFLRENVAGA